MKHFLTILAFLSLTALSYAQQSQNEEKKEVRIVIKTNVDGEKTTTILEGEAAEKYLEEEIEMTIQKAELVDLEKTMIVIEKSIESNMDALEKQIEKIDFEGLSEEIEIHIKKCTESIERTINESEEKE